MRYGDRPRNGEVSLYKHSCGERVESLLAAFVHLLVCPASKSTTAARYQSRSKLDFGPVRIHRAQDKFGNPVYWR